jgi:ABC-2 type transport system ATP-binding protein
MSLQVNAVSKTYDNGVQALKDVTLNVPKGMFGLLGPNGAGKSSLMRTIATLQEVDTGSILFNEQDILKNKESLRMQLGYLPQEFGVYPKISASELLDYIACLKGINQKNKRKEMVNNLLELTNLSDAGKRAVSSYSGGMKQRFGIAQALIGDPRLIIVDEPTAGLDPEERLRFYNILSEIGEDTTVILSTHIVSDVSDLCPNLAIINSGQVLTQTTPQEAVKSINGKVWSQLIEKSEIENIKNNYQLLSTKFKMGKSLVKVFSESDLSSKNFTCEEPILEDFYFSHIKGLLK